MQRFTKSFTQQEGLSDESIARAVAVMQTGRLHRYNTEANEISETSLLEKEFAEYLGVDYSLACASCGYAMTVALRAFGLKNNEPVLTNALTLSPVPGSIYAAGGRPILVESTDALVLDLDDLEQKLKATSARVLLISHMRGHVIDMEALLALLHQYEAVLIEDCAHTMGAQWNGKKSGTFGIAACFSTQSYKHINSGEGGLLVTNNSELMARAVILSGSYMFYDHHIAGPSEEAYENIKLKTPNCSGRMDNLRAAVLRPQLAELETRVKKWLVLYQALESKLQNLDNLTLITRSPKEYFVGSSFQFLIPKISATQAESFLKKCEEYGVFIKWFGAKEPHGYTSQYSSWHYLDSQSLPHTDQLLSSLFDIRLPLTFDVNDCHQIGEIIRYSFLKTLPKRQEND